jgi:hypothetical protein
MNTTNRALNRLLILVVGLLLIAAGGVAIVLATLPAVARQWRGTSADLRSGAPGWVAQPVLGSASLLVVGVVVLAVVLIVLLLAFIAKQGRGRTAAALQSDSAATATRIDLAVPRALLEEHLRDRGELAAVRIAAYEVRGTPMLKISATCRRGVSPALVAQVIGRAVADLERVVGADVPALVQLSGGFRAGRVTAAARPS